MSMCDCNQGRLPCTCKPQASAAQSAPMTPQVVKMTSIDGMQEVLNRHLVVADEHTDCAIIYRLTFDTIRAIYDEGRAQSAPVVPDGWRLVPVEPTQEMANAAGNLADSKWCYCLTKDNVRELFSAMLAAAPQPARQPLELSISPEWVRKAAEAEQGHVIAAGVPDPAARQEPLHITHRPLIRNAIGLLSMRRPMAPDVERVVDGLSAMLEGLPTPAGEASATWLQVAELAETPAAQQGTTSDRYRAELYDEVWQKAREMGYGNVTEALLALERGQCSTSRDEPAARHDQGDDCAHSEHVRPADGVCVECGEVVCKQGDEVRRLREALAERDALCWGVLGSSGKKRAEYLVKLQAALSASAEGKA